MSQVNYTINQNKVGNLFGHIKKDIQKVKTCVLYRRTTNVYSARQLAVFILSELENLSQMKKVIFFSIF